MNKIKVFISHSSKDEYFVKSLVQLLKVSLPGLKAEEIRCTSVDGTKMKPGAHFNEVLVSEISDSDVFIAILSEDSINSFYVAVEIGARWGSRKDIIPIMINGLSPEGIKAPLSSIHAVDAKSQAELSDLIESIAAKVGYASESHSSYLQSIISLMNLKPPIKWI